MKIEKSEILDPRGNSPMPRPLPARECECGCGHRFYPNRKDKVYLNKQHADFAYNNGKRKAKNQQQIKIEKILSKNDSILHKHFQVGKGEGEIEQYFEIIRADGFKSGYCIGQSSYKENEYQISYRYMYRLVKKNDVINIIIRKG